MKYLRHQDVFAAVFTLRALKKMLGKIVQLDIQNDTGLHSNLACLFQSYFSWAVRFATVRSVWVSSITEITSLNPAISRTTISIFIVSIVTFKDKPSSISTKFNTLRSFRIVLKLRAACNTVITIFTREASRWTL